VSVIVRVFDRFPGEVNVACAVASLLDTVSAAAPGQEVLENIQATGGVRLLMKSLLNPFNSLAVVAVLRALLHLVVLEGVFNSKRSLTNIMQMLSQT
jgi:hypothetical protein